MSLICEQYSYACKPKYPQSVGIELEIELSKKEPYSLIEEVNEDKELMQFWKIATEDSLRNGVEFILRKPLFTTRKSSKLDNQLYKAIKVLFDRLNQDESEFVTSIRTGIHLHFNVQQMTTEEIINLMHNYAVIEPILASVEGADRNGNCFCLRYKDTEYMFDYMLHKLKEGHSFNNRLFSIYGTDYFKYSSMNLCPISNLGSVEFRFLNTNKSANRLRKWISLFTYFIYSTGIIDYSYYLEDLQKAKTVEDILRIYLKRQDIDFLLGHNINKEELFEASIENLFPLLSYHTSILAYKDKYTVGYQDFLVSTHHQEEEEFIT